MKSRLLICFLRIFLSEDDSSTVGGTAQFRQPTTVGAVV